MSWWGFFGELKNYKCIIYFLCVVDFSHPSWDPFTIMLLLVHLYILLSSGTMGHCGQGFMFGENKRSIISLVHTNCRCRIKTNTAWVIILLFNDTKITASGDKTFLVNLYYQPVNQLFNCWVLFIFLKFLASRLLSYPSVSALLIKPVFYLMTDFDHTELYSITIVILLLPWILQFLKLSWFSWNELWI